MSKNEDTNNKVEEKPKEKSAMQQRGFFGDIGRDIKNIGVGLAALPAHFVTNPLDMAGKTALIAVSAIPVVGGFTAAAYAAKSSYRETGYVGRTIVKAAIAFAAGVAVPGAGAGIIAGLAAKNIGEQVEQSVQASVNAGERKTTFQAIGDKYKQAGKEIKELRTPEKRQEIVKDVKKFFSVEGIKDAYAAAKDTIGPLTPKALKQQNEEMIANIRKDQRVQLLVDQFPKKSRIEKLEQKVKESEVGRRVGQLGTHIKYEADKKLETLKNEAHEIRDNMREKLAHRKENPNIPNKQNEKKVRFDL